MISPEELEFIVKTKEFFEGSLEIEDAVDAVFNY